MSDQGLPPAGWYPDPEVAEGERYWDGAAWSEHRRPTAPPDPPVDPPVDPVSGEPVPGDPPTDPVPGSPWGTSDGAAASWQTGDGPAPQGGAPSWEVAQRGGAPAWRTATGPGVQGAGGTVDTWLWQSIVATILCCQPLGIVAIVMSAQAGSARDAGDLDLARKRAGQARTWTIAAVAAFFVLFLPFLFLVFIVPFA